MQVAFSFNSNYASQGNSDGLIHAVWALDPKSSTGLRLRH